MNSIIRNHLLHALHPRKCLARKLATQPTTMNVFDRRLKRLQREQAAKLPDSQVYEYLRDDAGYTLVDRICDIKRTFNLLLDLGCGTGFVSPHLTNEIARTVIQCDLCESWVQKSRVSSEVPTYKVTADDERLPFRANVFDIVVSSLNLHWVNDLPGCFRQVKNCLVQDGVFMGSMFCGDTLFELRSSLQMAELKHENGFGPHISPFTTPRDVGGLLQQTGYVLITIDNDEIVINYPSIHELMKDLKGMAENSCTYQRKLTLRRDTIKTADEYYKTEYGNSDGTIPATFQIVNFIGWKPHPDQAKPAKRGSGQVSIKDLDKLDTIIKDSGKHPEKTLHDLNEFSHDLDNEKDLDKDKDLDKLDTIIQDSGKNPDKTLHDLNEFSRDLDNEKK